MAAKIIAGVNFKGGVGKSTLIALLASIFNRKHGKSCVVNIAIGQNASNINEIETFDYADQLAIDDTTNVSELIAAIYEDYDYIFVDTPGELSDELVELLDYIDYFLVPYVDGTRCLNDTKICLESIFTEGVIEKNNHNVFLVHNSYTKDDEFEEVSEDYISFLKELESNNNIKINSKFTLLAHSKAVKTMEKKKASISTLSSKNKVAYRIFEKKTDILSNELYDFITNQ